MAILVYLDLKEATICIQELRAKKIQNAYKNLYKYYILIEFISK